VSTSPKSCPVCGNSTKEVLSNGDYMELDCPKCGHYKLSGSAEVVLNTRLLENPNRIPLVSHYIRKRVITAEDIPLITSSWIDNTVENGSLPSPLEQAHNLILWLGDNLKDRLDKQISWNKDSIASEIGAYNDNSVIAVLNMIANKGLVPKTERSTHLSLTYTGWELYEELKKGIAESKRAFMAMPFGYDRLNRYFEEFYVPAVADTGYKLERVDTNPGAGSITNRMLVEIRRSKFLVCELTHDNNGAYWEAGFAEGIGKPVIYLCKEDKDPANPTKRPHFDIRNHQTVFWTDDTLPEAMEKLKAAIRATFPDEARMEDLPLAPYPAALGYSGI
jgi:hypothetical protein